MTSKGEALLDTDPPLALVGAHYSISLIGGVSMPRSRALHAVTPGEKPSRKVQPKTVTQAATSGTPRELLTALRDRVAKDVEDPNTPSRDLAALSKRLMEIVREIEALDARDEEASDGPVPDAPYDASAI